MGKNGVDMNLQFANGTIMFLEADPTGSANLKFVILFRTGYWLQHHLGEEKFIRNWLERGGRKFFGCVSWLSLEELPIS